MVYRQWLSDNKILILILVAALLVIAIGVTIARPVTFVSPVSPLKIQSIEEEELNYLDKEGQIKWYENFFIWEPRNRSQSYAFITGTVYIYWSDVETGLSPVSVPVIRDRTELIIELELRGTEVYTQRIDTGVRGVIEPKSGVFDSFGWMWMDVAPDEYDEYIKAHWNADGDIIPLQLVRDGQVIGPVSDFALYREGLIIPELTYLPIVMKSD